MLATQQSWSQRPGPVGRQAQRNGAGERPSVVGASSTACSCRSQTTLARVLHPRSAAPIPRPINGANVGGTARALEEGQNVERASPGSLSSIASRDSHGRATTAAAPAVASPRAADSSRLSSQPSSALPQTFFSFSVLLVPFRNRSRKPPPQQVLPRRTARGAAYGAELVRAKPRARSRKRGTAESQSRGLSIPTKAPATAQLIRRQPEWQLPGVALGRGNRPAVHLEHDKRRQPGLQDDGALTFAACVVRSSRRCCCTYMKIKAYGQAEE